MTPLTFSTLSDLHQHLRGVVLVRLVTASALTTQLVYHMPGRPSDVRLLTIHSIPRIFDHDGKVEVLDGEMDYATSEPTELSDWF